MIIVAPHFSNPYFYSDVTHKSTFGLYTCCYYCISTPLRRKVPTYNRDLKFRLDKVDLIFKSTRPNYGRHAIKKVFGKCLDKLKVNGTKSMIGHALGGAGALEMVAVLEAIETNTLHPTINVTETEEEVEGIDLVIGESQEHVVNHAISNSFGFGGHNAVIVISRYEREK